MRSILIYALAAVLARPICAAGAHGGGISSAALAADDVCGAQEGRGCALNALQHQRHRDGLASLAVPSEGLPAAAVEEDVEEEPSELSSALFSLENTAEATRAEAAASAEVAAYSREAILQRAEANPNGKAEWWNITAGVNFPWSVMNGFLGSPKYLKKQEYYWVPVGGEWFPNGGNKTVLVKTSIRPPSPGTNKEMAMEGMFTFHDPVGDGWCYQRWPTAPTVTLAWLMNVPLNQHPTGEIPGLGYTILEKGKDCKALGYTTTLLKDTTFDQVAVAINSKSTSGSKFLYAFNKACPECTARYIAYWRSTKVASM